jgi:hypothetical protein
MGVGDQRHAPAALPPGKNRYHRGQGWVALRAGQNVCAKYRHYWNAIPVPSST